MREKLVSIGARRRRRIGLLDWMDATLVDIRFALRSLRAHWALSLTIIATLAIAIGASTAVFSVVNAVLVRPLPYGDADRLGFIIDNLGSRGFTEIGGKPGDIPDLRTGAPLLDIAAFFTVPDQPFDPPGETPEPISLAFATTNIFSVMKVPVVRGRNFVATDGTPNPPPPRIAPNEAAPAAPRTLLPRIGILGYDFWQRRYHGDSSVIGSTVLEAKSPVQIVGVASPNVELLLPTGAAPHSPDLWIALRLNLEQASRENGNYSLIARMKPGASVGTVRAQIDSVSADLLVRFPIRKAAGAHYEFEPMRDYLVRGVRPALIALMGAVAFLLIIACANVASLLFIRAAQRERELAVRAAIGGSPWRIARQLLVESMLLTAVAAIVGVAVAAVGVPLLVRLAPSNLPQLDEVSIDRTVLAFALAVAFVSSIVTGLVPAIRMSKPPLSAVLRASGSGASFRAVNLLRNTVVVTEIALSFVLLVGGGLMIRSFVALTRTDLGFDPRGVLTFTLTNRFFQSATERDNFVSRVHDALAATPGIIGVTTSIPLPLDGESNTGRWGPTAALTDSTLIRQAQYRRVLPGYFETMRTTLIAGRTFTRQDDSLGSHDVIIDDEIARLSFGDESAVGKTLVSRMNSRMNEEFDIIGVVKHERHATLVGHEIPELYFPEAVLPNAGGHWAVRATGDSAAIVTAVRAAVARVDPALFINEIQPMSTFVDKAMAPTRFALVLIGIFATIATLLATVGIYSVLLAFVRQRTSEIGIRMAFGAPTSSIFSLVVGRGMRLCAIGLALGIGLALVATRTMRSMLVSVRPADPATYVMMTVAFLIVAFVACWVPARRAAALDPNAALRDDTA